MSLLQDFKLQASMLDHVGWQEATLRVAGLLEWMRTNSQIKPILDDLKNNGPVYERLRNGGPNANREAVARAANIKDVAAVGLAMAELCSVPDRRDSLHQIANSFGVQPPVNLADPADFLAKQAIKLYLRPLLNYVMEQLPGEPATGAVDKVSREQLKFEFLKALYGEHERDPSPNHWVKLATIWQRVTGKYGENLSPELFNAAFNQLYAGHLINQAGGPEKQIQINERGIAAYDQMKAEHTTTTLAQTADSRTVFVVHGRNLVLRDSMFAFLRAIGLKPLEWSQAVAATGKASPYVGEILDAAFSMAQAVVVLMTPDDEARLRDEFHGSHEEPYEMQLTGQARPNVLFEAGMAMGRDANRAVLVQIGTLRPFSDVGGRHVVRLDNSSQRRHDLADRLRTAGCAVDLAGRDWYSAGSFVLNNSTASPSKMADTDSDQPQPSTELPPEMKKMLVRIANSPKGITREQAAEGLGLSKARIDHLFDQLKKHNFIRLYNTRMGEPICFSATPDGREYLESAGLL